MSIFNRGIQYLGIKTTPTTSSQHATTINYKFTQQNHIFANISINKFIQYKHDEFKIKLIGLRVIP